MHKKSGNMHDGMTRHEPKDCDKSMKPGHFVGPKAGHVNSEPTREKTASTPKTLGPRTA
jgi:hypothetical protein